VGDTVSTYILVTEKPWHDQLFAQLGQMPGAQWHRISSKEDFTAEKLQVLQPEKIFIPHWSYIIPAAIYDAFECIVFHMTDLPFGRGGSPLQNLIVRGLKETKISAIRVTKGIDTGDVYLKKPLDLSGTATDIFTRSASVIETMIDEIIAQQLQPVPQTGEVTEFKRRTPEQSNIVTLTSLEEVYDYIRMLDCEGYPKAYIDIPAFRLEFTEATLENGKLEAHVSIVKK